ncbi:MAG TPA: glycosyltransferase [Lysobacter sp.]
MKILLIAYEFPPSPSPQSLRWSYLTRELVRRGHDVHVLTPDLGPELGTPNAALDPRVIVHRTYAGPIRGFIAWHRRRRAAQAHVTNGTGQPTGAPTGVHRALRTPLEIKLVNAAFRISERLWFPDVRGEWTPFARRTMSTLLATGRFDVVISSHEPATCLELGLRARRATALPWIADLGDPVLAPYTPKRWRKRSLQLERATCDEASTVTVTAASAAALLVERHGGARQPAVLTQGFDDRPPTLPPAATGTLELAYAGSFYSFRRAEALFEAIAASKGVCLSVATVALPDALRTIAEKNPESFRLMGFLDHSDALALQAKAHVLVNIANRDAAQVPGKLYEYLGAGRPVLHLTHGGPDPGADLVRTLRRGWVVEDDVTAVATRLKRIRHDLQAGGWLDDVDLSPEPVRSYSWSAIGDRLDALLRESCRPE